MIIKSGIKILSLCEEKGQYRDRRESVEIERGSERWSDSNYRVRMEIPNTLVNYRPFLSWFCICRRKLRSNALTSLSRAYFIPLNSDNFIKIE